MTAALDADQHLRRFIHLPERSRVPAQLSANYFDHFEQRVICIGRFAEYLRDRELRGNTLFRFFSFSDVVEKRNALTGARISVACNAHRELHPHDYAVFSNDAFLDRSAVESAAFYRSLEVKARFEILRMRKS